MKILVTGASGFVGKATCSHLKAAGHEVIPVSHLRKDGVNSEALYPIDIADRESFASLDDVTEINAIVHCAGIAHRFGRTSRDEFWRVNVDGAANIAEFAARKGIERFVHLSSVLVYGPTNSTQAVTEQQLPSPSDDYSSSKLAGEMAVASVCEAAGTKLTILRPVPIIGEGSRGNVARLIRSIDRKRFVWIGDGRNERSFVYTSDVAEAILTALSFPDALATFNVTGGTMTVKEMVENISKKLGIKPPPRLIPNKIAYLALSASGQIAKVVKIGRYHRTLETWLSDSVFSGSALASRGFHPTTDVREALRREVSSYLASKE